MQILAIERFTKEEYEADSQKYMKVNLSTIQELHRRNIVRAYWSRGDKPGTVLMLEADSADHAKDILKSIPLVKRGVITYSVLPLEPYQVEEFMPEKKENLITLVYASAGKNWITKEDLNNILEASRKNNTKLGITGVLLYHEGSFLQVLEGQENRVNRLYKKIIKDHRHERVVKIAVLKDKERIFSEWSMGFASVTSEELESIEGLNNFFNDGSSLVDLNEGQVQNIMQEFKTGKWRQKTKEE